MPKRASAHFWKSVRPAGNIVDVDDSGILDVNITRVSEAGMVADEDVVAVEEPLEIQLGDGNEWTSVSITMRTPGSDNELAAGFLFTEGIIGARDEIAEICHHGPFTGHAHVRNIIRVR